MFELIKLGSTLQQQVRHQNDLSALAHRHEYWQYFLLYQDQGQSENHSSHDQFDNKA